MISQSEKAFRKADFNSNTDPKTIEYHVGEKFDQAGLPNPYIEDHDQVDQDNDDRDGRGLPADFAISAEPNNLTLDKGKSEAEPKLAAPKSNL